MKKLTRRGFYDLVWFKPMTELAKDLAYKSLAEGKGNTRICQRCGNKNDRRKSRYQKFEWRKVNSIGSGQA